MMSSTLLATSPSSPYLLEQLQQRIACDCQTHSAYVYGLKVAFYLMASRS